MTKSFQALGVSAPVTRALAARSIHEPSAKGSLRFVEVVDGVAIGPADALGRRSNRPGGFDGL